MTTVGYGTTTSGTSGLVSIPPAVGTDGVIMLPSMRSAVSAARETYFWRCYVAAQALRGNPPRNRRERRAARRRGQI